MRRILIIHAWGIGDWLFFTPVLRMLKETYPEIRIDVLLGTPATRYIVECFPEVSMIETVDLRKGRVGMLIAAFKTWFRNYDALLFTAGVESRKAAMLSRIMRAGKKAALLINDHSPGGLNLYSRYDNSIHRVENNLKLAGLLGLQIPSDAKPYLPVKGLPEPAPGSVLIHPGSDAANPHKRWPAERFAGVADALLNKGCPVSVILGPSEMKLDSAFSHLEGRRGLRIYKNLSFKDMLKVIAEYEMLLNSDSGLGHIASAMGRRTITIFGPADPRVARPYSDNAVIIKSNRECMPCHRRGGSFGCDERLCLMDIDVETVVRVISEFIQKKES